MSTAHAASASTTRSHSAAPAGSLWRGSIKGRSMISLQISAISCLYDAQRAFSQNVKPSVISLPADADPLLGLAAQVALQGGLLVLGIPFFEILLVVGFPGTAAGGAAVGTGWRHI